MKRLFVLLLGLLVCLSASAVVPQTTITVATSGSGTGTVSPGVGPHLYTPGEEITFTAAPDPGSYFGGWLLDAGGGATANVNSLSFVSEIPDYDFSATANFETSGYTLVTDIDGDGTVDPGPGSYRFTSGLEVTLTATPNGAAVFDHWEDELGNTVGTDATISVVMNANATRIAVFEYLPITGSIVINNNRSATNNMAVTLALTWAGGAGTGVVRMRFSNDGSNWTAWTPLQSTLSYNLPAGDGHKTVRVQYLDKLNNKSAIYSDYIRLDTMAPTGSIIINGGAANTTTSAVTLGMTWADGAGAQVTRMRFSDNGSTWTYWMPQTATRAYTLPAGLGYRTVRVQFLDGANNYSAVYSDYIKVVAP